jgi:spore coat polysaccharide biosynthesis protein SpsF
MARKLVAALACRNQGTRLYGKPFQNLDIANRITILDHLIDWVKTIECIDEIILGIAEGEHNLSFVDYCKRNGILYIVGDEIDVLKRLIRCGEKTNASDILRLSSESPYTYFEAIDKAWAEHVQGDFDFSCLDFVPDGVGFEIIKLSALKRAHKDGDERHRSEFCSLYIRENKLKFSINYVDVPATIKRTDIRLTVDYPEDLVLCRAVYSRFKEKTPKIPLEEILAFLDENPDLKELVEPFIEEGLKTMNL